MSVFKRNKKYWIGFWYNRKRYRLPSPDNSLAGARAYETMYKSRLLNGEKIKEEPEEVIEVPNFKKFSKQWFDVYVKTNNKPSEVRNKESALRVHLIPFFGKKKINKINNLDVENYKAKQINTHLSNKSINNTLIILNKCLATALEWELIEKKPKIKMLKVAPQKFDFLEEDEVKSLLAQTKGWLKEMTLIGLQAGLRFGEIIALSWDDLDFSARKIVVRNAIANGIFGTPKNNKVREIPMSRNISELLIKRYQSKGLLFVPYHGEYYTYNLCAKELKRACRRANLRAISWHVLRHTFASHLAQKGVAMKVVQELLGHSSIITTMRYSHINSASLEAAIKTLEDSEEKINFGHNLDTIYKMGEKMVQNNSSLH